MPGVTKRENRPSYRDTSDFDALDMTPQRRFDVKNGSQRSNGRYSEDSESHESPTYLLEHLATFSVGAQYGITGPKDGLRRLLQMEKSSGIWTQRMQMRLEKKWVVIIDNENGDVVERFPLRLISEPTSYTSPDPREIYNNVLVFIVRDEEHSPPEMHIFQCARISAQEVVNEMKMFMSGKWKPSHRENGRPLPPPPQNPAPEPPLNGVNVREQVNLFNAVAAAAASPPKEDNMMNRASSSGYHHHHSSRSELGSQHHADGNDSEASSGGSDKCERDVAILNHCFDDIERFVARLQHAAAAFKELERRQRSRKSKKKDMGDGMLSIRAKPPSEKEFIDILQKFKLSFNLLAKLKSHIHDPNAPELVHFLFTPLALIVDAARDSNYSSTLASRVVAPLPTRDAVELLQNCCTSKESDLWHSLGRGWTTTRDQWGAPEGPYHPVFSDGWAPENPVVDTPRPEEEFHHPVELHPPSRQENRYREEFHFSERPSSPAHHPLDSTSEIATPRRQLYERNGAVTPLSEPHELRDRDVRSDFSADSIDRSEQQQPHPQLQFDRSQRLFAEELAARGACAVQVMYPRTANNDKELTVLRGECLEVLDDSRKWWKAKNSRGQVGHVPHTIVGRIGEEDMRSTSDGARASGGENGHKDSPPARPPIHPAPADWVRRERQGKKGEFRYF